MKFDEEVIQMHSEFCSLFSNVIRMKIMWVLKERGESNVNDLSEEIDSSAQNISQHLRIMRDRNAVKMRKDGREVYYRVSNDNFIKGAAFAVLTLDLGFQSFENIWSNKIHMFALYLAWFTIVITIVRGIPVIVEEVGVLKNPEPDKI